MSAESGQKQGAVDILAEPLPTVWLVIGNESFTVTETVRRVAEHALAGGLASFNRSEGSADEAQVVNLVRQAATLPMMGARRVCVLRDLEKASSKDLALLLDYVQAPSPSTIFIMTGSGTPSASEGSDPGRKLQNAVKKVGRLLRFDVGATDPLEFLVDRARAAGVRLDRVDAVLLVELVGKDLGLLATELDKLICFVGGTGRISASDIEEVCCVLAEAVIWDLTDAIVRRSAADALEITHRLLEDGDAPQRLLPIIAWQMRQLIALQACDARGQNPFDVGIRMPSSKLGAARAALKARPLRPDRMMSLLAEANRQMHGHATGERRVLEGLVLRLVSGQVR